jgi:hypothetical protein
MEIDENKDVPPNDLHRWLLGSRIFKRLGMHGVSTTKSRPLLLEVIVLSIHAKNRAYQIRTGS